MLVQVDVLQKSSVLSTPHPLHQYCPTPELLYEVELLAYWFPDWPVREALGVTQVSEVVNVTEELILQLGVVNHRHSTILHVLCMGAWVYVHVCVWVVACV